MNVDLLTDIRHLEALRAEWEALLRRSPMDEPMLSPCWLLGWWKVFGEGSRRTPRVLSVREDGALVGLVPLLGRIHWYRPGIPYRRLEMLGSGEDEADEICSEYLGPISAAGYEDAVFAALGRALAGGVVGSWDEVLFPAMDGGSPFPERLAAGLRAAGLHTDVEPAGMAPYVPLPASWEAYLSALPSTRRYLVRRSLRDYATWAGDGARVRVASNLAELREGWAILLALHSERWSESGGGAFRSPRFKGFHEAVMPELLAQGALELLWLEVGSQPVAIAYNLVWRGKVYFYQSGRLTDLPRGIRPGIVLHAHAIMRAIKAGRREYDFLNGHAQYKLQLSLALRPLVRVRAVRAPRRESARRFTEVAVRMVRERVRSRRGVPRPAEEPAHSEGEREE